MTDIREHRLLILMFAAQNMQIKALKDVLLSRNVLTDEDVTVFEAFAESVAPAAIQTTKKAYLRAAKEIGLDIPLSDDEK